MEQYMCVHGHFYQPPMENPWLEDIELQDSAAAPLFFCLKTLISEQKNQNNIAHHRQNTYFPAYPKYDIIPAYLM
jgi:hypothetical protein